MGLVTSSDTTQETWDHLRFDRQEVHEVMIDGYLAHITLFHPEHEGEPWHGQVFHDGCSGMKARAPTRDATVLLLLKEVMYDRDHGADQALAGDRWAEERARQRLNEMGLFADDVTWYGLKPS